MRSQSLRRPQAPSAREGAPPIRQLLVRWSMAFALISALTLMIMRVRSVLLFDHFPLVFTSGGEADAALGIWRAAHGNTYPDPMKIPFTASYYNWLFYISYAEICKAVLSLRGFGANAFSTIGRLFTLSGLALACLLSLRVMRLVVGSGDRLPTTALFLVYYSLLGPLIGWWAVSLHPEIWATTLSIASMLGLIAIYDRMPLGAVAMASVASLAAWSFKQSYLYVALAIGLFLLEKRDWRGLSLAVFTHLLGIGAALGIGSANYRHSLILAGTDGFTVTALMRNLLTLLPKAGAILLMAGVVLWDKTARTALWRDTPGRFALLAALSCLVVVPTSAKHGAADYYYIPLVVFFSFVGGRIDEVWRHGPPPKPITGILSLAWTLHGMLCIGVLLGLVGVASVADDDVKYRAERTCIRDLPSPMWAADEKLSLPWIHEKGPHFVKFFDYDSYPERGLEADGIGGMVQSGAFASLVLPHGESLQEIDRREVPRFYVLSGENCAGLDIYQRDNSVPRPNRPIPLRPGPSAAP